MIAVASHAVKPRPHLRPPSPATFAMKPIHVLPGSLFLNAVASRMMKPMQWLRPPSPARLSVETQD